MVDTSSFRAWLKERRKALDLTQDELALRVGCTGESIRKIEAGAQRPSKQIAERLAERLEIPVDEREEFVRLARAIPTERERQEEDVRRVKGYYLREQIGAGGYGAVFRAYQLAVQRDVAIKMIAPHYANQPEFIRRFEYEAQLVARLEHPHIVPLFDYWRDRSGAYLVMRWMRGGNLQTMLQPGPLPFDVAFHLLAQIAAGLTAAHRQGIVHRDLKPANLLLDEVGNVYLADFGIAKDAQHPALAAPDGVERLSSSPAYSAPEQIRGEPVTPRTDIYSLGILLYEMLAGGHPFHAATPTEQIASHLWEEVPPLTSRRPDLPASLDTLLAKATAKDPMLRYADVTSLLEDVRRIARSGTAAPRVASLDRDQLQRGLPETAETPHTMPDAPGRMYAEATAAHVENPYKGLRAFQEADAPDFFGREALIQHLVTRLAEPGTLQRFLAVVGPSGSGKSSLVRAGLIPALRQGILPGAERWFVVTMLPGPHPLDALEAALLQVAVDPSVSVMEQLEQDERGLSCAITRILPDDAATELVLVVDQFEEVFTLVKDEPERLHFLNSLVAAVSEPHSRLWVIITLRADFFDRPLLYPTFGEVIRQRTAPVVALSPDEMRRAIVGPAARAELDLEPGLVTAIVTEVGAQPGALPLLQYALTELVERRDGRRLTLAAYHATGGVPGALARRADELFAGLTTEEQRATHRLFLRLVALGEGTENTRRRVRRSEVASLADGSQIDTVLEIYARHRLLTFDHDAETREPTVELAHEALLHAWSRLRHWLIEDREGLRLQRRLTDAAQVWAATNYEQGELLRGAPLMHALEWAAGHPGALNVLEQRFLDASEEAARRVEQREREAARRMAEAERLARARALAAAAISNLPVDPERSVLLALRAVETTYDDDRSVLPEAETALHQAVAATRVVRRLVGHSEAVTSIAWSPDGARLATASYDRTARVWDAATGTELLTLDGHQKMVNAIAWSPDGARLASCSDDGTARIWNAATGAVLVTITHQGDVIQNIAWSPDGTRLATASYDKTARVWDAATGKSMLTLPVQENAVWTLAWSPDSMHLATGMYRQSQLRIWEVARNAPPIRPLQSLDGGDLVHAAAWSPDGRRLATAGDTGTTVWNTDSGERLLHLFGHTNILTSLAWSRDGLLLATAGQDRKVKIWESATGREVLALAGHGGSILSVTWSPDGARVASAGDDGAVIWTVEPSREVLTDASQPSDSIGWSPDGTRLATATKGNQARVLDAATGKVLLMLEDTGEPARRISWSPDGTRLATNYADGTARIWDGSSGRALLAFGGNAPGAVITPAWSPNGGRILTAGTRNTAFIWDARTGQRLVILEAPIIPVEGQTDDHIYVNAAAFNRDGTRVATGSDDHAVRIWDAQSGRLLRTLEGHRGWVRGVAFSPDDTRLATGSRDGTAKVWDLASGREIWTLTGHTSTVTTVAWSPDGTRLATASRDGTARLWDATTGQEVLMLTGDGTGVLDVAFSPDGKRLVTSGDTGIRVYALPIEEIMALARTRVTRSLTKEECRRYLHSEQQALTP